MKDTERWTPEAISSAARALAKVRPAYAEMLAFYGKLYALQATYRLGVGLEPIVISEKMLAQKRAAGLPLVPKEAYPIDLDNAGRLLDEICSLAASANADLAVAADKIAAATASKTITAASLWKGVKNEGGLSETAKELGVASDLLATLTYQAARPSIMVATEQLQHYLKDAQTWQKGYCPLCGHPPVLAMLDHEGHRQLHCGFCWHTWPVPRRFCPFCETTDAKMLRYFYSEQEKEYRVDVCDGCGKYIKTVDTREAGRAIYPPLEAVATLHLDMKARELGHAVGGETMLI